MQALKQNEQEVRTMKKDKFLSSMTNGSVASAVTDNSTGSAMDPYACEAPTLSWDGDLTSDHIKQIEKGSVFKPGKAKELYDYLAKNYNGIYERLNYPDPQMVADMTY